MSERPAARRRPAATRRRKTRRQDNHGILARLAARTTTHLSLTLSPTYSFPSGAGGLADGSLGLSWVTSDPVFLEIGRFLPVTLELVTLALLISFLIAIPLGMASATKPGGIADRIAFVWGLFAGARCCRS